MAEEREFLMTAANGMQVWVPESKLEAWKQAQENPSAAEKDQQEQIASRVLKRLEALLQEARER